MPTKQELQQQLHAQIAEHVAPKLEAAAAGAEGSEGTAPPAEPTAPAAATPASTEGAAAQATPPVEGTTPPAEAPTGTAEEDVPTSYYGVDLPGTAEERKAVIDALSGRDQHIQKLLRDKAEEAKAGEAAPAAEPVAPAAPQAPAEVTDEDILRDLGLNPENEDMEDPKVQAIVGLARFALDLKEEVGSVKQSAAVRETEALWENQLDALEKQYGSLPEGITRDDVLAHAAKAGIAEPVDAYWRIMGPARAEVLAAVKARRDAAETALKRGSSSPVKTRGSEGETADAPLEAKNTKDAVKEAMLRLEKAGKFDFGRE